MVQATGATVYVGAGEVEALQAAAPSAKLSPLVGGERIAVGDADDRGAADAGPHGRRHLAISSTATS